MLIKGQRRDGAVLTEGSAAEIAVATASLSLDWLRGHDEAASAMALDAAPGVIRLFSIGWRLIGQLPQRLLGTCETALASAALNTKLARQPWLKSEVEGALDDLERSSRAREFAAAREALTLLSLAFDANACRALQGVLDDVPHIGDGAATRWIGSMDDLRVIARLMQQLR